MIRLREQARSLFEDGGAEGFILESLRLYVLCDAMRFSHLPVAGGLYDQDPRLLDEWQVIAEVRAQAEAKKNQQQHPRAGSQNLTSL